MPWSVADRHYPSKLVNFRSASTPEYPSPIKAAMEMMGRPVGPVRGPMRNLTAEQNATLRKELEALGVFDCSESTGW